MMAQNSKDKRDYALRGCAGLSLLSAFVMIFMSLLLFGTRIKDLKSSEFPSTGVPSSLPEEDEPYQELLSDMNKQWNQAREILVSCSVLSVLSGLLQVIFCGFVILSDSKAIQLYIRKWIIVHFILLILLIIILVNCAVLSERHKEKNGNNLVSTLKEYLQKERPFTDYSDLFRFLATDQTFLYIGVGINLGVIFVLIGATMFLLRDRTGDYESCD